MLDKFKRFGWGYLLISLLLCAVGLCLVSFSQMLEVATRAIGIILIVFGIVYFVLNMAAKRRGIGFALRTVVVLAAVIGGTITAIPSTGAIEALISLLALFLIIDGAFKLQTTVLSKRYGIPLWWFVLIPAALVIFGGFLTLRYCGAWQSETLSVLLGITALLDSIANFLSPFYLLSCDTLMKKEAVGDYLDHQKATEEKKDTAEGTEN